MRARGGGIPPCGGRGAVNNGIKDSLRCVFRDCNSACPRKGVHAWRVSRTFELQWLNVGISAVRGLEKGDPPTAKSNYGTTIVAANSPKASLQTSPRQWRQRQSSGESSGVVEVDSSKVR
jgi:hypothetical protein